MAKSISKEKLQELRSKVLSPRQRLVTAGGSNAEVIRLFVNQSFPKDKRPNWGSENLRINKEQHGWSLVNYSTPILYVDDATPDKYYFNVQKYSVTTSKIQGQLRQQLPSRMVVETDEAGIRAAIDGQPVSGDSDVPTPKAPAKKPATPQVDALPGMTPLGLKPSASKTAACPETLKDEMIQKCSDPEEEDLDPEHNDGETFDDNTPEEEDVMIQSEGRLGSETVAYQRSRPIARLNQNDEDPWESFYTAIAAHMEKQQFWPNVWNVSDHGNVEMDGGWLDYQKAHKTAAKAEQMEIAGEKWSATKVDDGYNVADGLTRLIMHVGTKATLSSDQLRSIVFNELGKRNVLVATVEKSMALLPKGHKVRVVDVDMKRKEVKYASLENTTTGWAKIEKFAFKLQSGEGYQAVEECIQRIRDRITTVQERLQSSSSDEYKGSLQKITSDLDSFDSTKPEMFTGIETALADLESKLSIKAYAPVKPKPTDAASLPPDMEYILDEATGEWIKSKKEM